MSRITKDQLLMGVAYAAKRRSEDPHLQVGAAAMDVEGRIIAVAYNGLSPNMVLPEWLMSDREAKRDLMIHAEQNLCALFTRGTAYTVATTIEPCSHCCRTLIAHGVKRILFSKYYDRTPGLASKICAAHNVEIIHAGTE